MLLVSQFSGGIPGMVLVEYLALEEAPAGEFGREFGKDPRSR
jgi:hypothetical protein